jgi:hypothetical protein
VNSPGLFVAYAQILKVLVCFDSWWPDEMPTSEHYRKSAQECRRHAKEAGDTLERETLLRMAAQWDRLADHKARKEAEDN